MKKYMLLSLFLSALLSFSACGGSDNDGGAAPSAEGITVSPTSVSVTDKETEQRISITAPKDWNAYADEACSSWVTVTTSGTAKTTGTIALKITANTSCEARLGHVVVMSGSSRVSIPVTQAAAEASETPDSLKGPEGYRLVWHDEFDAPSLSADWKIENWPAGKVNNELQIYPGTAEIDGQKLIAVDNGVLSVTARKIGGKIYSGRLYALPAKGWKYGYMEAKMRLPKGKGTWPAFWMMPVDFKSWPADGEIDIMEHVGFNENVVHSTIHCNKYNNTGTPIESARRMVAGATTGFHIYAMEWTADHITFFVDGETLLTYRNDGTGRDAWPFDKAFYIIFNLAWGGDWGGQQGVDETALPATMAVDYVRVYQK